MSTVLVDLTKRTFDSIREVGLDLLKLRIGEFAFNDAVATGVAPAIIDVLAWFHEQNAHYYDRRRINSLLILADTRESMSVLTLAQGYRMRPATGASVSVLVSPNPPQPAQITIQKGTKITAGGLTFESVEDAIIPAGVAIWPDGSTDDIIVFTEGVTREDRFTSDGSAFQSFPLTLPSVIDGSLEVQVNGEVWEEVPSLVFVEGDQSGRDEYVGDATDTQEYTLTLLNAIIDKDDEDGMAVLVYPFGGTHADVQLWQQVDTFTGAPREYLALADIDGVTTLRFGLSADGAAPGIGDSIQVLYLITGSQKRYQLVYDPDDRGVILFGDGVFGVIPPDTAEILTTYRVGGGVLGNVAPGVINNSVSGILPSGANTPVQVVNAERGSGGEPPETIDHARFFAPRFAKSNERAVTQSDFTVLAATYIDQVFGAPSHASAFLKQRVPELNTVQVALWGRDDKGRIALPGTALKVGVKKFLDTKRTITTTVEMIDGEIVVMDVTVSVELVQGQTRQVVFAAVTQAIEEFFSSADLRPGIDVSISRLYDAIQSTDGVARAVIDGVIGSKLIQVDIGVGDGTTQEFSGDFVLEEGTVVVGQSLAVTDGTQQAVDDGGGSFLGDVDAGGTNTVDYTNGAFTTTLANAPPIGSVVTAEAKLTVFFPFVEDIGTSDGSVAAIDGATQHYPIIERAPQGIWSGDKVKVIDGFRVGASDQFRGTLPRGIDPASVSISDGGIQVVTDNGSGTMLQGATPVGTVSYSTGVMDFTFLGAVTLTVVASWSTSVVDIFLPEEFLPLTAGRLMLWGGFSADGLQAGGGELIARDDGAGNMTGDVLAGGSVIYETGRVFFEWNAVPAPGIGGGATRFGFLNEVPDGVLTQFTYDVFDAPGGVGGAGAVVDLTAASGDDGEGRTRLQFSDLSTDGFTVEDSYDNWQGRIHGQSLSREGVNTLVYAPTGVNNTANGVVTFANPLPAGTTQDFIVQVTNAGVFLYSSFVFRVKTPSTPGLDKGLFADNNGRLWGDTADTFPTSRLDHLRGRYLANLSGSPIAAGRTLQLTYDSETSVPPARDIPLAGDQVATLGRVNLIETAPEVQANV